MSSTESYCFNVPNCSVLHWCRGGCRAVHLTDEKAIDITCKIKQEIIPFILQETQGYYRTMVVIYKHHTVDNFGNLSAIL
jgi:sulfatase maturation enzyme AslB (radical SAM superfamily)